MRVWTLLLLALLLAGCLGASRPDASGVEPVRVAGEHPLPRGDEWPAGLVGPFELRQIVKLRVPSFDGVVLDGWLLLPAVPEGVQVPVVLWSAPYFGQCSWMPPTSAQAAQGGYPACGYAVGDDPELWDNNLVSESVPVRLLFEHGYAVAIVNVRGTGNSGGCFEWFGRNEQRDQAVLVEWLGTQSWSNGRIGMMGLSYHGTTPWEAAVQNPPHLKTIVVAGMISDAYLFSHTPQGATFATIGLFESHFAWRVSLSPPIKGGPLHATVQHLPVLPERACPDLVKAITDDLVGTGTDRRDAGFWQERRLIDRFPQIQSSILLTHGFQDHWGSGHQSQESEVWGVLTTPWKRQLEGQWGHEFPNFNSIRRDWALPDWNERLLAWLDFWLKGIGEAPPRAGLVDYQDGTGAWHESCAWPPLESRPEALYLGPGRLLPAPAAGQGSFRSLPSDDGSQEPLCPDQTTTTIGLVYQTEPATSDVLLAGNPFAYLRVTSDRPGGQLALHLFDVGPEFRCNNGQVQGARRLGVGVADLRFHAGNYQGRDFPTNTPTDLRIDITNFAEVIPAGHRLALVASYGDVLDRASQPWAPLITIHGDGTMPSHVVLPVVRGSFGGTSTNLDYPPRPFLPPTRPDT